MAAHTLGVICMEMLLSLLGRHHRPTIMQAKHPEVVPDPVSPSNMEFSRSRSVTFRWSWLRTLFVSSVGQGR